MDWNRHLALDSSMDHRLGYPCLLKPTQSNGTFPHHLIFTRVCL